jgi:NADH-quinone oxidoreductase subunit J
VTGQLIAAQAAGASGQMGLGESVIFWILGPIAVIGALGMVLSRNAVHSALWLVATMFGLGVFYIMEQGPFIGFVQIIVYTGAIMILFLFVLMLIGRDASDSVVETLRGQRVAGVLLGLGLAALLVAVLADALGGTQAKGLGVGSGFTTNLQDLARLLFHNYVFAFEATSALLITAAVGAMVLAHVERVRGGRRTQRDRVRERFRSGQYPGPKPGPGVYAFGDSVARPAMLPDGSTGDTGVPGAARQGTQRLTGPQRPEPLEPMERSDRR